MKIIKYSLSTTKKFFVIAIFFALSVLISNCASTNVTYPRQSNTNQPQPTNITSDDCPCKSKKMRSSKELSNLNDNSATSENEKELRKISENKDGKYHEVGLASWYGRDFDGKKTASGEIFNSRKLTAAHRKLPLGTIILVKNMENEKEVFLKVNDRGPYIDGRILDVSEYAAELLEYKTAGLTHVGIHIVKKPDPKLSYNSQGDGATYQYFSSINNARNNSEELTTESELTTKPEIKHTRLLNAVQADYGQNYYSVQVGAFSSSRPAHKLSRKLSHYNNAVRLSRRGLSYIVRIGKFDNRQNAEILKIKLEEDGYSAFVTEPY